jgi:hypothetical protein
MLIYGSEDWALNRSERKTEIAKMHFLRRVSGYTLTDQVCNMTVQNALQIYTLEEGLQAYKTSGIITS